MNIDYLDLDDLLAAATAALGHPAEVRDYGLLESALARPRASVFGEDAYPTLHEKAAALLESLVGNHALIDGNKRLAVVATFLFYGMNGYAISATEDELFDFMIEVATGVLDTVSKIAHRLAALAVPVGR